MALLTLLVYILFIPLVVSADTYWINQTTYNQASLTFETNHYGQNITIPYSAIIQSITMNMNSDSIVSIYIYDSYLKTRLLGISSPIDLTIGWNDYTFVFNPLYVHSGSKPYFEVVSSGTGNLRYSSVNPYSGGEMFIDGIGYNSDDFLMNVQLNNDSRSLSNWSFDQGSGIWLNDTSGFNNNGTIYGATWTTDSVNGTALSFDGINDFIIINASDSLNLTAPFSISLWFNYNTTGSILALINKDEDVATKRQWDLSKNANEGLTFDWWDSSDGFHTMNTQSIYDSCFNKWCFVQVIFDNSSGGVIRLNDVQQSQFAYTGDFKLSDADVYIGTQFNGGAGYSKLIDEIKIYNYALNSTESTELYQQFQPVPSYPTGGIILSSEYPPMTKSITFSWHDTEYPGDELLVSKDPNFNPGLLVVDSFTSNDYYTATLEIGNTYYWKVKQYNSGIFGKTSIVNNFTIIGGSTTTGTGIEGIIYTLTNNNIIPINGANVYLYDNLSTYSTMVTTVHEGYFIFTNLNNYTTYAIRASKSPEYDDSPIMYITTGAGNISRQNIAMSLKVNPYNPEIVFSTFYLRYTNTTPIQNAVVNVYETGSVLPSVTGNTGSDGDITFKLIKTQKYTVDFKDAVGNILASWSGYPAETIFVVVRQHIVITPIAYPNTTIVNETNGTYGSYGWSFGDFTGANLTSQYGIGVKGQGIITGLIALFMIPYGGTISVIGIFAGLVLLKIFSYKFTLFMAMVSIAWYIVKKEFT